MTELERASPSQLCLLEKEMAKFSKTSSKAQQARKMATSFLLPLPSWSRKRPTKSPWNSGIRRMTTALLSLSKTWLSTSDTRLPSCVRVSSISHLYFTRSSCTPPVPTATLITSAATASPMACTAPWKPKKWMEETSFLSIFASTASILSFLEMGAKINSSVTSTESIRFVETDPPKSALIWP